MRLVLIGDSHLARIRAQQWPDLDLANFAVGGASSRDLSDQLAATAITASDIILVSIGTNDAAPWK